MYPLNVECVQQIHRQPGQAINPKPEASGQGRFTTSGMIVCDGAKSCLGQRPQVAMPGVGRITQSVGEQHRLSFAYFDHPQPVLTDSDEANLGFGSQELYPFRITGHRAQSYHKETEQGSRSASARCDRAQSNQCILDSQPAGAGEELCHLRGEKG